MVHNSWPPHAQQVLCMRISAVMQAHNSCCATEDTNYLNNISYLFQQHILSFPTTRIGWIINLWHTLAWLFKWCHPLEFGKLFHLVEFDGCSIYDDLYFVFSLCSHVIIWIFVPGITERLNADDTMFFTLIPQHYI